MAYIPIGLILASVDPYGPTWQFPGRKERRAIRFGWLRLRRAPRPGADAAPQARPAPCFSAASGSPAR